MWPFKRKLPPVPAEPDRATLASNAAAQIRMLKDLLETAPVKHSKRIVGVIEAWEHYYRALVCSANKESTEHKFLALPNGQVAFCLDCGWSPS